MKKQPLPTAKEHLEEVSPSLADELCKNRLRSSIVSAMEEYAELKCEALREENERLTAIVKEYARVNNNAITQLWEQHCKIEQALKGE